MQKSSGGRKTARGDSDYSNKKKKLVEDPRHSPGDGRGPRRMGNEQKKKRKRKTVVAKDDNVSKSETRRSARPRRNPFAACLFVERQLSELHTPADPTSLWFLIKDPYSAQIKKKKKKKEKRKRVGTSFQFFFYSFNFHHCWYHPARCEYRRSNKFQIVFVRILSPSLPARNFRASVFPSTIDRLWNRRFQLSRKDFK